MIRYFIFGLSMTLACYGASVDNGAKLFDGVKSFKNGAVACVACHNAKSSLVVGGGSLSIIDLTPMGGTLTYTLSDTKSMSSVIMQKAYEGKLPTANEIADLDAFLIDAASKPYEGSNDNFLTLGVTGFVVMLVGLSLVGSKRKKETVNQKIFDRQKKSTWREI